MRRRVLFCTQTAHVRGGLETWLDEIVPFLLRRGWQPIVGLARGRRFHSPRAYRAAHPSFETVEIDGQLGTREARVAALRRTFRAVRPDLVVPINIADALEAVARERMDGDTPRLIVMLRGHEHGVLQDIRRYRDSIDLAVGGNRLLRELIAVWAEFPDARIRYIPSGSRRRAMAVRPPKPPDRIRIGYIGRLEECGKRVLDLIDFARSLDERGVAYELIVAGEGPATTDLERGLASQASAGRVRILGYVPVDELYASVFPQLDVLVLFSTAESGPQVVWQAMHYGVVPVVSRYRGAMAERTLRDGETALLFPVGEPETAAAHVARLSRDLEFLRSIAAAAEREVDPRYLLDHSLERWRQAFEDALTVPPAIGQPLPETASTPSGTLERLRIPAHLAFAARWLLGRLPEARDPGDEWPHHGPIDAATFRQIEELAIALDR